MDNVIVWPNETGAVAVCYPTGELPLDEVLAKDCPSNAIVISVSSLPQNQGIFFEAWELNNSSVTVNLNKAKEIGHTFRRAKRAKEFAPLDIKATIPAEAKTAEAERQLIRDKYAAMQTKIDAAKTPEDIKKALGVE